MGPLVVYTGAPVVSTGDTVPVGRVTALEATIHNARMEALIIYRTEVLIKQTKNNHLDKLVSSTNVTEQNSV